LLFYPSLVGLVEGFASKMAECMDLISTVETTGDLW